MSLNWEKSRRCRTLECVEVAPVWEKPDSSMSLNWEKSRRCGGRCDSGNCVDVAPMWEKSDASAETDSVEVASTLRGVAVRDGKLGEDSPILYFTVDEWSSFRRGLLDGQFAYDEQHAVAAR